MIRIHKDLSAIPAKLQFSPTAARNTAKTHWDAVISAAKWLDSEFYKNDDTKEALKKCYNNKCAFCEKSLLDTWGQVEHFRPKAIYYWLGFSWDNLLWACGQCNQPKHNHFPVRGTRATYSGETFAQIHGLSAGYDASELPSLFNPETADPTPLLWFEPDGHIRSAQYQLAETITICKLNRPDLLDERMTVLNDDLKGELEIIYAGYSPKALNKIEETKRVKAQVSIKIKGFCKKILDKRSFIAWRKYILRDCSTFLDFGDSLFNMIIRLSIEEARRDPSLRAAFV